MNFPLRTRVLYSLNVGMLYFHFLFFLFFKSPPEDMIIDF